MKIYLQIIFLFLMLSAGAQVSDNFNDGDFTNSPSWSGNDSDFNVNAAGQLQLNAANAGNSFLSLSANPTTLDSCEWRFYIHLNFSPSTSNYCRVYLSSDNQDLQQPVNGYYLQFGESLSNDAIELFRQDGTIHTPVCRATSGLIANSFFAGVKVQRSNSGLWTISVDYSGGTNYSAEASGTDITYNNSAWIGINCVYTSGNINKFYFDDFYAGPAMPDTIQPYASNINVESASVISIIFSETMDSISLNDFNSYSVNNGIGNPSQITRDSSNHLKYLISFPSYFQPNTSYSLSVSGLRDDAQNPMNNLNWDFTYYPIATSAQLNDVIFSEIYFEPSSLSPLSNAEYLEIYNRKDSTIVLSGWKISDGGSDGLIPELRLGPYGFIVLRSGNDSMEFLSIPNTVAVNSFPTLNNDVGDHIRLTDDDGTLIDEIEFSNANYNDAHKEGGGWSIERIDPDFTCKDAKNWTASVSNFHGTPGQRNSVDGNYTDNAKPFLLNAFLNDSNILMVIFSEEISTGSDDLSNYLIHASDGSAFFPNSLSKSGGDSVILFFATPFSKGIYTIEISDLLKDCPGNEFMTGHTLRFGFAEEPNHEDIVINELLFNCNDGGNDFLELYNRSQKNIDLKDWIIAEVNFDDSTDIKESAVVSKGHRLMFPGEYLVLSEDAKKVKQFYSCPKEFAFADVYSMPDFSSSSAIAIMYDNFGNTIDAFRYSDDLHFPLLSETRGVSLERLSTENNFDENNNWHSAAASAGFATPGMRNSQHVDQSSGGGEVEIDVEIFSPDDDGYNDVFPVSCHFPQTGTMLSLNVFDYNGQPVKTLLAGETVGNEGIVIWDGLTDTKTLAPAGIYILFAKSFDLDGNSKVFKKTCFLTRTH